MNLIASILFASVGLIWDASPDQTVTGYALYYAPVNASMTNRVDVGTPTETSVTNLTEGVSYWFFVTAYNSVGTESDPSNVLIYTPSVRVFVPQNPQVRRGW